jgi:3-oxoacyl-[acyl-carrier-protein] synthase-3/clorobiocin biosynthesis protein CloN2
MHRGDEPLHPASVVAGRPLEFQRRMDAFVGGPVLSPDLAALWLQTLQEVAARALAEAGIGKADVTRVALPNSPRVGRDVVLNTIGFDEKIDTWEYGRTLGHSANDQTLALAHLLERGEIGPGDHVLLVGVGPGVAHAAAVVQILDRPSWHTAEAR